MTNFHTTTEDFEWYNDIIDDIWNDKKLDGSNYVQIKEIQQKVWDRIPLLKDEMDFLITLWKRHY